MNAHADCASPGMLIMPTPHEKAGWARCAAALFEHGCIEAASALTVSAFVPDDCFIAAERYDVLMDIYRPWLVDGTLPATVLP